jgi:UDP-N-acetyl-D-glucosamine dehydrogenase
MNKVVVIGQGYVGLPLAIAASKASCEVTGVDINAQKISLINDRNSPVEDISDSEINTAINSGKYKASSDSYIHPSTEIICICVPTPLGKNHQPDLEILKSASVKMLARI